MLSLWDAAPFWRPRGDAPARLEQLDIGQARFRDLHLIRSGFLLAFLTWFTLINLAVIAQLVFAIQPTSHICLTRCLALRPHFLTVFG